MNDNIFFGFEYFEDILMFSYQKISSFILIKVCFYVTGCRQNIWRHGSNTCGYTRKLLPVRKYSRKKQPQLQELPHSILIICKLISASAANCHRAISTIFTRTVRVRFSHACSPRKPRDNTASNVMNSFPLLLAAGDIGSRTKFIEITRYIWTE